VRKEGIFEYVKMSTSLGGNIVIYCPSPIFPEKPPLVGMGMGNDRKAAEQKDAVPYKQG
jgi:hypothetical protein